MKKDGRVEVRIDLPVVDIEDVRDLVLDVFQGEILTSVKDHSPVDTGYLRQHWHEGERTENQVEIYNNTEYAFWLIRGTGVFGPHKTPICATGIQFAGTIMAVDRPRALHWKDKSGNDVFRRCVRGIKPMTFLQDGITEGVDNAVQALQGIFNPEGVTMI
ncbi:MAG: hypothetical protein WC489_07365 [Patescibacteria group bacterium]|jgi:hypothetical protein